MQCTFMSVGTGGSGSFKFPCQAPPPTPRPSAGPSAALETLAHQGPTIREARPHATPIGRAAAVSGLLPRPSTCAGEVLLRQQSLRTPASARPLLSRSAAVLATEREPAQTLSHHVGSFECGPVCVQARRCCSHCTHLLRPLQSSCHAA